MQSVLVANWKRVMPLDMLWIVGGFCNDHSKKASLIYRNG